jgi:hypothetical protein
MTLKTDYYDGLTGLNQQLKDAFDAGVAFVGTNFSALQTALLTAASEAKTKFTVTLTTTYKSTPMRANNGDNLLKKAYFAGIAQGLGDSDIYNYECELKLNTSDSETLKINFNFNFQTT